MNSRGSGARRVPVTMREHFGAGGARERFELAQLVFAGRTSQSDAHQESTFAAAGTLKQREPFRSQVAVAHSLADGRLRAFFFAGRQANARAGTTVEIACL